MSVPENDLYVYTSRRSGGSQGTPWGVSAGYQTIYTIHRKDCAATRRLKWTEAQPFPGHLTRTRVLALLNVRLCQRCAPDHSELIATLSATRESDA